MSTDTPGHGGGGPRTTDDPGPEDPGTGLPPTVADDVLDSERRRVMLARLVRADGPVPVVALAEHVAAAELDVPTDEVDGDRRETVREELYETDVPKLTALRIATFDSRLACLELAEHADAVLDRWAGRAAEGDLPAAP